MDIDTRGSRQFVDLDRAERRGFDLLARMMFQMSQTMYLRHVPFRHDPDDPIVCHFDEPRDSVGDSALVSTKHLSQLVIEGPGLLDEVPSNPSRIVEGFAAVFAVLCQMTF